MTSMLQRFLCSIVFGVWAVAWALGARSDMVIGFFLALATIALVVSELEQSKTLERIRREVRHDR